MKTRTRFIIIIAAALLLTTSVILVPRISEARRAKWLSGQMAQRQNLRSMLLRTKDKTKDQKGDIVVVASYHSDASIPLRDMKPQLAIPKQQHSNENHEVPAPAHNGPDP